MIDNETWWYYCQSRYYNPDWGRFINTDNVYGKKGSLLSHNFFCYCKNNPVMFRDPAGTDGELSIWDVFGGGYVAEIVTESAPKQILGSSMLGCTYINRHIETTNTGNPDAIISGSVFTRVTTGADWTNASTGAIVFEKSCSNLRVTIGLNDISVKLSVKSLLSNNQYGLSVGVSPKNAAVVVSGSSKTRIDNKVSNETVYSAAGSAFSYLAVLLWLAQKGFFLLRLRLFLTLLESYLVIKL